MYLSDRQPWWDWCVKNQHAGFTLPTYDIWLRWHAFNEASPVGTQPQEATETALQRAKQRFKRGG